MSQARSPFLAFNLMSILAVSTAAASAADVAKVNGKTITSDQMRQALGTLTESQRQSLLKDPNSRRQLLNGMIDQEVLIQQAIKEKLDQDAAYTEAMEAFRRQYLSNRILDKNLAAKVNESAARKYYDQNKSRFATDQVHAMHILVDDELTARNVLKLAKAKDADFQALAEKHSKDPSAKNNRGDLGPITRDAPFVREFKDAAFAGAKGEIVGPIKTAFGYHLIKIVDKKFGRALEYDEVELRVKSELRDELVRSYLGKLKQQAKISVDDKALDTL
jgi:peptidyl-prolyl cis-trans isomerase C